MSLKTTLPTAALTLALLFTTQPSFAQDRQLFWGDTHLHTSNSFDAYFRGNLSADPETAYRYAQGYPVIHPYHRARVRIDTPLDFLVIADHAEYLGVMRTVNEDGIPLAGLSDDQIARSPEIEALVRSAVEQESGRTVVPQLLRNEGPPREAARTGGLDYEFIPNSNLIARTIWDEATALADQHYKPGQFTTFIGWEWSPIPGGANLHRVIFTDADAETAQTFEPFHMGHSPYPEDLWDWLEEIEERTQADFIAIPHNSNLSKGYMFPEVTIKGQPVTVDYARTRMRWEPVAEMTQLKGDSETTSALSPDDEFAEFETYSYYIQDTIEDYNAAQGDYVRSALRRGLELEQELGVNPYKLGMIGSTDAHTGLASAEEQNFHGKMARDGVPENKLKNPRFPAAASGWAMSAQGLAAVWADRNDRPSIMAAFKRREVYATTGSRISVRVFAGWTFDEEDLHAENFADLGYAQGVPMGGDLVDDGAACARILWFRTACAPKFMIRAARDPVGANLDRVQIVKGWLDEDGQTHEKVFDVAWAGGSERLQDDGRLTPIGNTVDLTMATYENSIGIDQLNTVWADPEFDPNSKSFYYVRVLEIPTPRHSTADAIALGMGEPDRGALTLQERAYSSPIWFTPSR